jgi:hypothetical protein
VVLRETVLHGKVQRALAAAYVHDAAPLDVVPIERGGNHPVDRVAAGAKALPRACFKSWAHSGAGHRHAGTDTGVISVNADSS